MAHPRSPNLLLAALPLADYELIGPHLKAFDLINEVVLYEAGDTITRAYFPYDGVISLVVGLQTGEMIEAVMVGRFGVAGGAAAIDGNIAVNQAIVQIAGAGSWLDIVTLRKAADQSQAVRSMLIRNEQATFAQAQQSAACNAAHTLEARMCRWMLLVRDLTGRDEFNLTQEFLAEMLGVRRTSVSVVAGTLQQAGMIQYRRGHMQLTDLDGLRAAACECYQTVRTQFDRLLGIRLES
ncbi:MAG: Crp/Fnr family transcriptional regulator [Deltaproteobacteria bacterium]|nr:Crp/Fnr family transcriptional regulator [Deltaproteobacteria bacterium]